MSRGNPISDPFGALNLPSAVRTQADKLLQNINAGATVIDTLRTADRAEGFALGVETVRALRPADIEILYRAYDEATQSRLAELI